MKVVDMYVIVVLIYMNGFIRNEGYLNNKFIQLYYITTLYTNNTQIHISNCIFIGIMDSKKKGEKWSDTWNHCVYLSLDDHEIWKCNEEGTGR